MKSRSILNILRPRSYSDNVIGEIRNFEELNKITLPPIYSLFYKTFEIEDDIEFCYRYYYEEPRSSKGKSLITRNIEFEPKPNYLPSLDYFFKLNSIGTVLDKYTDDGTYDEENESSLRDKKLLPIIKHDNSMLITVSYDKHNIDNIYLYNTDLSEKDGRFQKLADDVFHYLRGTIISDDEDQKELYKSLSKNWNDEHWKRTTEDNNR
ncbi:hypothetical protein SAMN06298216_3908 [Spirosomataceae bacterium TFI 002]|nr:hypothetical protein SAMN06298216_3908 [Spirosomataceae bacterium TFI 002]